jgi:hypothetical protein
MSFGGTTITTAATTRGRGGPLDEEEKYPSLDKLRDSTAIESTNSLDLNNGKSDVNDDDETTKRRKKKSILEECADVVLNSTRRDGDGNNNNDEKEVSELQIAYHVKRLAELAAAPFLSSSGKKDVVFVVAGKGGDENNGHHHNHHHREENGAKKDDIISNKEKEEEQNFRGIQTNEEADIVMAVFETIAERESALLRETCAESLGLLSRAFLAVDSIYEEKLLEIAFVLLEDDDPDVVSKTEKQFSVICENITKDCIDRMLIPHVIKVMFEENDEQLRISSLNVMKNILIGSGHGISFVENCYHETNISSDKDLKTMDEMIGCLSSASKDESYRVRESFIQNAVEIATGLREIIPTIDEASKLSAIKAHLKALVDGFILLCEDENWAVRFNCVKSLHAMAKLSSDAAGEKSAGTDISTDTVLDLFEKLSNDVSKKVQLLTSCELGNIIASLLPGDVNEAKLSGMIQRYCETVREMSTNRSGTNAKDADVEQVRISCASYFGAMCEKLAPMGKWDDIVEAFRLLSSRPPTSSVMDEHTNNSESTNWLLNSNAHKARLEIAKSLQTIVNSLPGSIVVRDICHVVETTFLNDSNDEVKMVTISQLHHLLQKKRESTSDESKCASSPPPPSPPPSSSLVGRSSSSIVNLLSSLAEDSSAYVSLSPLKSRKPAAADSVGSWRVRLELASALGNISNNMPPLQPQPSSLLSISLKLLKDPVNDVRKAASSMDSFYYVFKNSLPLLFSEPPTRSSSSRAEYKDASNAIESIIKMASSKVWTERRTFAECSGRALLALGEQEERIQKQDKKLLQMQSTLLTKLCFLVASDAVSSVRLAALEALIELISRDNSLASDPIILSSLKSDGNEDGVGLNAIVAEARARLSNVINEVSFSKITVSS